MLQRCFLLGAVVLALLAPSPARAAQGDYGLSLIFAYGPYYTQNRWIPIRATVTNRSNQEIRGTIVCPIKGANGRVTFRMPIVAPAMSNSSHVGYINIPELAERSSGKKKDGSIPPLFIAHWENEQGGQMVRSEVLGRLIGEDDFGGDIGSIPLNRPLMLVLGDFSSDEDSPAQDNVNDTSAFADMFVGPDGTRIHAHTQDAFDAPRHLNGYDMAGVVVLHNVRLDRFDAAQRQALIDYMAAGGTVLLSAPAPAGDPTGTWLAPYLPASYVGTRYATGVALNGAATRPVQPLDLTEWVTDQASPASAKVVARDEQYVHLAYNPVGLGRLAVSSFPVTGMDVKRPQVRELWRRTLVPETPILPWDHSRLAASERQMLASMIGLKVPPWTGAAAIVGAYVLLVLVIQLLARQGKRPMGFAAAIGAAILLAGGLLAVSLVKDETVELSMARVSVTDLANGGVRHEAFTLLGKGDLNLTPATGASLRSAAGGASDDIDLTVNPPAVRTTIQPRQMDHVWQATAAIDPGKSLRVLGVFDAQGLSLAIDNNVGEVGAPLLVTERGHYSLPDFATGQSTARATAANLNPPGLPINSKALQLETEQLRGRILQAAVSPAAEQLLVARSPLESPLTLAGWMAQPPPPLVSLSGDRTPRVVRDNALVRTRVDVQPSPVGSTVKIDAPFTRLVAGVEGGTLPYDAHKREWIPQFNAPHEFTVGFAIPRAVGKLRPTRVTLEADLNAAQHTVTVRRGQCAGGKVRSNPAGETVQTWEKPIGRQTVSFDVGPEDFDANGWVWLLFQIDTPTVGSAQWQVNDLGLGYEGVIAGPPQPAVLPTREEVPAAAPSRTAGPPKRSAKTPAKAPAKRPAKTPAKKKPATPKPATGAKK